MNSLSSIALSGLQAAQEAARASAHNIANAETEDFRRVEVTQQAREGGGVDTHTRRAGTPGSALEQDVVDQLKARNAFLANLAVFRRADRMAGALFDLEA
jgi:flagellar hook-associated protein FlgK